MASDSNGRDVAELSTAPVPSTGEIESLVRSLATTMRSTGLTELDVVFGTVSVHLRGGAAVLGAVVPEAAITFAEDVIDATPGHVITAPMVGTFYTSSTPGAAPFVSVGDTITAGTVVGIIEAMKIMNEITADRGGVVDAVLVGNAQAVEYGSPLVRLRPGS